MATISDQLDALLVGVENMKIEPPVDRAYFVALQQRHQQQHVGPKHGDPIIEKEYPATKEYKPLTINNKIYGQIFRNFAMFYLHVESKDQDKLIAVMQTLERHTQLIEKEQLKHPDDPVYIYALAQTILEILTTFQVMSDPSIENGLSNHEKDLIKGLALHFNEVFTSQLALFTTAQDHEKEKDDEEDEVDEEDVELEVEEVENVESGY